MYIPVHNQVTCVHLCLKLEVEVPGILEVLVCSPVQLDLNPLQSLTCGFVMWNFLISVKDHFSLVLKKDEFKSNINENNVKINIYKACLDLTDG